MLDVNIIPADMQASLMQADQGVFQSPSKNDDLRAAAEKFEAIFLNEFMKQARKTKLADDLFGSSAKTTYEEMLDREYADNLSDKINLGIADALVRQLGEPARYTMANLFDIGKSGLQAYRQSLAVTGQNIANIDTDGYKRREAGLEEIPAGTGSVTGIQRQTGVGYVSLTFEDLLMNFC